MPRKNNQPVERSATGAAIAGAAGGAAGTAVTILSQQVAAKLGGLGKKKK